MRGWAGRLFACALGFAALLLCSLAPASAHRLAPSLLELREAGQSDGASGVQVLWKTPRLRTAGAPLRPLLPARCAPLSATQVEDQPAARVERWAVDCGPGGLVGEKVGAAGLAESGTDVLLHITLADGRVVRALLSEDAAEFRIPQRERAGDVLRAYARLGVEHLLGGLDHVLFVAGLTLLLSGRRLLGAVTGFTIGHSITLALATLGWVRLPVGLVELGVAASLVALGLELSRATRLRPIARAPLTAALGFGLLHGLGFAAVLADVGLPSGSIPLALFAFNIGVESGQLLLIAALLPGLLALDRARHSWPTLVTQAPATALGSLGVFLLLDRAARLL